MVSTWVGLKWWRFPARPGPYHRYSAEGVRMRGGSSKSRMLDSSSDVAKNIHYIYGTITITITNIFFIVRVRGRTSTHYRKV